MYNTNLSVVIFEKKSNERLGKREVFFSTTDPVNKTLDTNKTQKRFVLFLKFYRERNTLFTALKLFQLIYYGTNKNCNVNTALFWNKL